MIERAYTVHQINQWHNYNAKTKWENIARLLWLKVFYVTVIIIIPSELKCCDKKGFEEGYLS